nr:Protein phosphatase 2C domain containing protein [Haemonchus contortus]
MSISRIHSIADEDRQTSLEIPIGYQRFSNSPFITNKKTNNKFDMPAVQGKRRSSSLPLYDDDDMPPPKKTGGLYSDDEEPDTSTSVTGSATINNSDETPNGGDATTEQTSMSSIDGHETVKGSEPLQLISVLGCRRGQREDMQDAHLLIEDLSLNLTFVKRCALFAIFDGHAGTRAAKYCEDKLPDVLKKKLSSYSDLSTLEKQLKRVFAETFKSIDEGFLAEARKTKPVWKDGTTVTCVLLLNDSLYVANLGDSKAIVCRSKDGGFSHIELTVNHNPTMYEERVRIQKAGGTVKDGRVNGIIEVSRSIGDGQFKTYGVTCIPDMKKLTITERDRFLSTFDFLFNLDSFQ